MDLETLDKYRYYKKATETISTELEEMYNPVSSISFQYYYNKSKDMTGSTIRTLRKVERQEERLQQMLGEYVDLAESVETWLADLNDPIAEIIVRNRYILGKTWGDVSNALYGHPGGMSAARMYLIRLLEKENSKK